MKWVYVIVYMANGYQDLAVFTSLVKAEEEYGRIRDKYGLKDASSTFYLRQAFGENHAGKVSLTLMKVIPNTCHL